EGKEGSWVGRGCLLGGDCRGDESPSPRNEGGSGNDGSASLHPCAKAARNPTHAKNKNMRDGRRGRTVQAEASHYVAPNRRRSHRKCVGPSLADDRSGVAPKVQAEALHYEER